MKQSVHSRMLLTAVLAAVLIIAVFGWRMMAGSGRSGQTLTPEQAGLGKPQYPSGSSPLSGK